MTFRQATDALSVPLERVAEIVGRSYRTVVAYRYGERAVPAEVKRRLAAFMREHSESLSQAADELESNDGAPS